MLLNLPFIGHYPISQAFGENPAVYQSISCSGYGLHGHDGIDFATPVGVQVVAVQSGAVLDAGEHARFGQFVLLGHEWGQSLYAHLEQRSVTKGQSVSAGQMIGVSGASGAASAPHLHFGLRVHPFSTEDGWCGYCDPQPYLERINTPRGAILGPHILGGVHRHLSLLQRWQPRLLVVVDPNPDEIGQLRALCPQTIIIGRVFEPDHVVTDFIRADPQAAARWAHERTLSRMSPHVDYWQFANEVLQAKDELPLLNSFEMERMELAERAGYRCAILAFSVGNPDLPEADRMGCWRLVYPAIERAERNGHVVAVHQYAAPTMTAPTLDWHIHRLEHHVLRRLPFKKVQFAVTEFGIDGLLLGPDKKGWQSYLDADAYVDQLLRAAHYLERFSGRVLGYTVYTHGATGGWDNYNIEGAVADALASRLDRGTWQQVNIDSGGLAPDDSAAPIMPGGGGAPVPPVKPPPVEPPPVKPPPIEPLPIKPPPVEPPIEPPGGGDTMPIERRISDWISQFNMSFKTYDQRPDNPAGEIVYLIKDVFTTRNGSWEVTGEVGSIPQWARDAYLSSNFMEGSASRHLFAAAIGLDGQFIKDQEILYWSDGFDRLGDPSYDGYVHERTKQSSGWAGLTMFGSSIYAPENGEAGPWCWAPGDASDVMCGGGIPSGEAISTFVVWQAVAREDLEQPTPPVEPPVEPPPVEPPPVEPPVEPPPVERRKGTWVDYLNLKVRGIDERPDHPPAQDDITYIIKDIFTTRDGQWDPADIVGSVDQWARDAYLKPMGAPDFFDDAGADHHLFAAIIGLDGQLMRDTEIIYWSDGFDKLGDPAYNEYVSRLTKTHSGWANIPLSPGANYVPERGESGPWCWTPRGAAEVICGGGMPAKQHISFFVVWQAVKKSAVQPEQPPAGDFNIFLPIIMGAPAPDDSSSPAQPPVSVNLASVPFTIDSGNLPPPRVRQAAWSQLGLEFHPASTLAEYARLHGLGRPLTPEFEADGFVIQGFRDGVVYAPQEDRSNVRHMAW